MRLERGEIVRADLTAPASTLFFPFLELILITALCWMGIGYMDQPGSTWDVNLRNALVGVWVALALWRFVLPVLRGRRQRFMVTDRRILARAGRLGARVDSIPLRQVHSVRRYRRGISLALYGHDRPLYFENVPKAKRIERMIGGSLPRVPMRF